MTQLRALSTVLVSLAASSIALVSGCDGDPQPADAALGAGDAMSALDAGLLADAAGGGLGSCAAPRRVTLTLDEVTSVSGDTSGAAPGSLELGAACRNADVSARPPQEVIAVEVPGTGDIGVQFDLTVGTAIDFDTVVELRTACETAPVGADACFDDVADDELRSAGAFMATGGSTIYLVVSGYPDSSTGAATEGEYTMQLVATANAAPTLTGATARRVDDDRLEIFVTGMDPDANAVGVGVQLLGADDALIPLEAATPTDVGPYTFLFDAEVTTTSFTLERVTAPGSADFDGIGAATRLRLFTYDLYGARSATRDVTVEMVSEVGFGSSCDDTHLCRAPNECTAGTCVASADTLALCRAARAVTLSAPTGAAPSVHTERVTLASGVGAVPGLRCEYTADAAEQVLAVTVPEGSFDLVASTNLAANAIDLDTIVYVRSTCADDTSELSCDDDYAGAPEGDYRSEVILEAATAGTYYVFVDGYAPFDAATAVSIELRLRPLLAAGQACDPTGVQNRCTDGVCPAAAMCP